MNTRLIFAQNLRTIQPQQKNKVLNKVQTLSSEQNSSKCRTISKVHFPYNSSHLQYCISTWGMTSKNALHPLEKLHKRIVRIMTKSSPY